MISALASCSLTVLQSSGSPMMCATWRICSSRSEKSWLTACNRGRVDAGSFFEAFSVSAMQFRLRPVLYLLAEPAPSCRLGTRFSCESWGRSRCRANSWYVEKSWARATPPWSFLPRAGDVKVRCQLPRERPSPPRRAAPDHSQHTECAVASINCTRNYRSHGRKQPPARCVHLAYYTSHERGSAQRKGTTPETAAS